MWLKGLTAVGQVSNQAHTIQGCGHLLRHLDSLAELIEKAVHDGDHIHIPGVEITPLSCILQQADGKAGAGIDSFGGPPAAKKQPVFAQGIGTE